VSLNIVSAKNIINIFFLYWIVKMSEKWETEVIKVDLKSMNTEQVFSQMIETFQKTLPRTLLLLKQ